MPKFQKGHKFGKGVNVQLRRDLTVELISQLNEVLESPDGTKRPKLHRVIKNLITQATTGADVVNEDGTITEGTGDLTAIKEIFDRLEGQAASADRGTERRPGADGVSHS